MAKVRFKKKENNIFNVKLYIEKFINLYDIKIFSLKNKKYKVKKIFVKKELILKSPKKCKIKEFSKLKFKNVFAIF